jgi:hypothetical protein
VPRGDQSRLVHSFLFQISYVSTDNGHNYNGDSEHTTTTAAAAAATATTTTTTTN